MREEMRRRWNHRVRGKAVEKAGKRLFLLLVAAIVAVGCSTTRVVEVPRVHTEYIRTTDSIKQIDTVFYDRETVVTQLDSEAMAQYGIQLKSAEKAWLVRSKELERKIELLSKSKTDTFIQIDTIPKIIKVNELTHWQKTKIRCFPYLFAFFVGACLVVFYRLWRKFR